jgi:hypothetical protein
MPGINRTKISKQILKSLTDKGLMKDIIIFRKGSNAFKEKKEDLYVVSLKGYYHKGNSNSLNFNIVDGGKLSNPGEEKLLLVYNDDSLKVLKNDYFILDDVKYEITDKGNVENIIFDMSLRRV